MVLVADGELPIRAPGKTPSSVIDIGPKIGEAAEGCFIALDQNAVFYRSGVHSCGFSEGTPLLSVRERQLVLVVEDDRASARLILKRLERLDVDTIHKADGHAGLAVARELHPDLILLDNHMPGMTGLEVCEHLKNDTATSQIPIVFLTASNESEDKVRAFALGAYDYVTKPFCSAELTARVSAALRQQTLLQALERQALTDRLTGLANRTQLLTCLSEAIGRLKVESNEKFAVLFLDFDRFKLVNDSLGHEIGDELLKSIAERLKARLRNQSEVRRFDIHDMAARLGGDEFVVLLQPIEDLHAATQVAARLCEHLSNAHELDGHEVVSTASIGITTSDMGYERAEDLIRDADIAMYHAKRSGKNKCTVFDGRMREEVQRKLQLENDLRHAMERGEFSLLYHPCVCLRNGSLKGFEALLRWNHPDLGVILPDTIIPLAEELGITVPIGEWVLREACRQLTCWEHHFTDDALEICVNISQHELADKNIVRTVNQALRESDVSPHRLWIEVSEKTISNGGDLLIPIFQRLRNNGVKIAMDDFGTGYSSLSHLHELPIDLLMIDPSYTRIMEERAKFSAIFQSIVTLAHNLDIGVVVEGVETAAQIAQLQAFDCDFARGFYFGKPLSPDAVDDYIVEARHKSKSA